MYFGDGEGGVREAVPFGPVDGRTYALALADLDRDGVLDVVAGRAGQPDAAYLRGAPAEPMRELVFGEPEDVTYGLDVGDVNGDGFPDVAVAVSDGPNRIYLNLPEKPEPRRERRPR